tara:strand:- start:437 stop:1087 length:651 start_codon:yes stop_codon:yes gene_type:complete
MALQDLQEQLDLDTSRSQTFFEKVARENIGDDCRKEIDLHKCYVSGAKHLARDSDGLGDLTHLLVAANTEFESRQSVGIAAFFRNHGAVAAAFIFGICFSGVFSLFSFTGLNNHPWQSNVFEVTIVVDSPSDLEEATIAFDFPEGVLFVGENLNDSVVIDTDIMEGANEFVLPLKISRENAENESFSFDAIISHGDSLKPFTLSLNRKQFFESPRV